MECDQLPRRHQELLSVPAWLLSSPRQMDLHRHPVLLLCFSAQELSLLAKGSSGSCS